MIKNQAKIIINGVNYTRYLTLPVSGAQLLDEQLDEVSLTLKAVKRSRPFERTTPVTLSIEQQLTMDRNKPTTQLQGFNSVFLLADDKMTENPVGSGRYDHDLYLIEYTKFLELFVVDSLTFTNSIARIYTGNPVTVSPLYSQGEYRDPLIYPNYNRNDERPLKEGAGYLTPYEPNTTLHIYGYDELFVLPTPELTQNIYWTERKATLVYPDGTEQELSNNGEDIQLSIEGGYYIRYYYEWVLHQYGIGTIGDYYYSAGVATFYFAVVSNKKPLTKMTCKDVVLRLIDLAEPITQGETSRFTLNEETAKRLEKIYAPELSITQSTMREALKEVGKIVHGEPRLTFTQRGHGEISFDFFGETKKAVINKRKYSGLSLSSSLAEYCTRIDSSAENIINQLDYAQGAVIEPYRSGYKTVRTETVYARVTDENMIIATDRPIYHLIGLEVGIVSRNGQPITTQGYELRDYVFEETVYNSQLSSYRADYPYSKAYALYFTRGEKNINGLNFKDEDYAIFPAFKKYAIVNILEKVAGAGLTFENIDYPLLAFRVTYVPYFNARVGHSKLNTNDIEDFYTPTALPYNQSANIIQSTYYGENLKGVVSRLGTVEKSYTYILPRFEQLPKIGTMFDNNYYISAVSWQLYPSYIQATVALSKDFNRLSQYIQPPTEKRYYEVSERSAYARNVLYTESVVIGDKIADGIDPDCMLGDNFKTQVRNIFQPNRTAYVPITRVRAWGGTYQNPVYLPYTIPDTQKTPLNCVQLPVTSTAIGNTIVFSWAYKDNYSAGDRVTFAESDEVSGYYQDDYPYTDYYGRMYYYNFDLQEGGKRPNDLTEQTEMGLKLPYEPSVSPVVLKSIYSTKVSGKPYIIRKDSREVLQFNAEVEFISNRENLYIGSAFASSMSYVGATHSKRPKAYALKFPINKFTKKLSEMGVTYTDGVLDNEYGEEIKYSVSQLINGVHTITLQPLPCDCYGIVFITEVTTTTEQAINEQGEEVTETIYNGGEVLMLSVSDMKQGETYEPIIINYRHTLFKK